MKRPIGVNAAGEVMFIEEVKTMMEKVSDAAEVEARLLVVVRNAMLRFFGEVVVASMAITNGKVSTPMGWIEDVDMTDPINFKRDGEAVPVPYTAEVTVGVDVDFSITKLAQEVLDALITAEMKGPN